MPKSAPPLCIVRPDERPPVASYRSRWNDWTPTTTPFICTIGADLDESRRLAEQLQRLREQYAQQVAE